MSLIALTSSRNHILSSYCDISGDFQISRITHNQNLNILLTVSNVHLKVSMMHLQKVEQNRCSVVDDLRVMNFF